MNCWKSSDDFPEKRHLLSRRLIKLCAREVAGAEAAPHTMHVTFKNHNTERILLIDNDNAFNSINPKVMLHNLKFLCLAIATYICYKCPLRLFIIGGVELQSKEGITQRDPTTIGAYALSI